MRAITLHGTGDIRVDSVPDATVVDGTDAVVRVDATAVCGTDLAFYRGWRPSTEDQRMGHEFVGTVMEIGPEVRTIRVGDRVIVPFNASDGTCDYCVEGLPTSCRNIQVWGMTPGIDGAQGEAVRVPFADGTLVAIPSGTDDVMLPALLTLTDVMATGHHAAVSAGVGAGDDVAVFGDGAVGLCAVLAARRLGATRIVAFSSHADRAAVASQFGATDIVTERGQAAVDQLLDLTDGRGIKKVLECVGTAQSWDTALGAVRNGGAIGWVGSPATHGPALGEIFMRNLKIAGGVAHVRAYLPALLDDVLTGALDPSPVFTTTTDLAGVARAYRDMDSRSTLKALVKP